MGRFRFPVFRRAEVLVLLFWLAWPQAARLQAQVSYSTGSGKTSVFAYYDPLNPPPKAPATTAATPTYFVPTLPTVSPSQYAAEKSALAPFVKSSFPLPPSVQVVPQPVIPRAPAASTPIVQAPTFSWQGIPDTGYQPPSPDLAVGPSDVIMVVNSTIAQFTRSGAMVKQTAFGDWFASLLPTICPSGLGQCLLFDPVVRYDQLHGHFLFLASSRDFLAKAAYNLISVSNGATYAGGWKIFALNAAIDGTTATLNWADFWRFAYDNEALYLAGNLYDQNGGFQYGKIRVVKKSELYNPATTTLDYTEVWNMQNADGTAASSLDPVQQRGMPSAVNTGGLFVNAADTLPAAYLTVWQINNPLAATLTLTRSTVTGLKSYYAPAPAPQAGGFSPIDPGDSRLLKAIYRDGYIYTARDTGYTDQTTTVTYDVIATATMTLSSQAWLTNANTFYPAFDVPATTAPGAPFATANQITGTTTAADGSLTFAGITRLKAGEDFFNPGGPTPFRWGDYFGGAVDPVSGGLWASGEYAKPAVGGIGQWGTWAGYFPWLTVQAYADVDPSLPYFDYINVLSVWQATAGCSVTPTARFCPNDIVTRNQMAALLIRSMFGSTFTYTQTPYFTDVPSTDPFFPYIQKLRDLGITKGCGATAFCPGDPINRWAAAILIIRGKLASLAGDNFPFPAAPYAVDVPPNDLGFPFIQKMYELGITSGCTATAYCPDRVITRQEMAVFLTRAFLN